MNHPYGLLAALVDGTLDEEDLAGVQAHLDTCPLCREDVAHASAGREAARSLPQATAPADLHHRVVTAAGGRGRGVPGHGAPGWYRWAGVAAAAAVVVTIAIALPDVGDGGIERSTEGTEGPMVAAGDAAGVVSERRVEIQDRDYDAKGLEQLASTVGTGSAELAEANGSQVTLTDAARCVSEAFDEQPVGRLARLIQARFEGREAYIAVYLEGPGANEPPDTAAVWVAAKDDCSILSFASARI